MLCPGCVIAYDKSYRTDDDVLLNTMGYQQVTEMCRSSVIARGLSNSIR